MDKKRCSVNGCENSYYAKGYCHKHYEFFRRNGEGEIVYRKNIIKTCNVPGCNEKITDLSRCGLCRFHRIRRKNKTDLLRQKGTKGELNVNWAGGVSEYPNHYTMKKNRIIVLKAANYICYFCGKKANEAHHKDLSKDNHSIKNLVAACHKCNSQIRNPRCRSTSKFRRLYGKSLEELSIILKKSITTIYNMHTAGKTKRLRFLLNLEYYYKKD